jgi:hypothetical protein
LTDDPVKLFFGSIVYPSRIDPAKKQHEPNCCVRF